MRLDKYLTAAGICSRSEAGRAVRQGQVTVNGVPARKADVQIDEDRDQVLYFGREVVFRKYTYVMLNKPEGYVSATEDGRDPTVMELLPMEWRRLGLFPCGRLDKNTLGLMLLTNNGSLAHRLLAPKHHVDKKYAFRAKKALSNEDVKKLENGVDIGGYVTAPCSVCLNAPDSGFITLHEGKYHQIKLMLEAVSNSILYLERVSFGPLVLDPSLDRGQSRLLIPEEISALEALG